MTHASLVVDISSVTKQYGALRPLRIDRLQISAGEQVAIIGLDQPAAEVFISLITGAGLPDTGTVAVFGRETATINDSSEWFATLDRFGIVSDRSAILEPLTVIQNLAVPFSLDIEPPSNELRERAVALALESGMAEDTWDRPCHDLSPAHRLRLRLARAFALAPELLLLEHPSATLARADVSAFGRTVRALSERRGAAAITLTMDRDLASAVATKTLTLDPATGRLKEGRFGRIGLWS
jgi:ABC-type transporter Mla maintaining outer membrane lipid asymmetry ATPase subunit MlaF